MPSFTTSFGTTVRPSVLRRIRERLVDDNNDHERVMEDELSDVLPEHDARLDEAREVMSHVEDLIADEPDLCDVCGEPADDGEGWAGLCGNCADVAAASGF